ncbi:MAG TPA: 30S ribosomal protein S9 [Dehalococcoidia bacterium]|nr:30S ribosomal protein S9 [Dehalococcoidia bacterium]
MTTQQYFAGTGRRKTSVARVRLYPGAQEVIVNGRPLKEALPRLVLQEAALRPLTLTGNAGKFGVQVKVEGGGHTGWAGAISHGIARALVEFDENLKPQLRRFGLLTRDSRMKERKKYGLRKARKATQYTKR